MPLQNIDFLNYRKLCSYSPAQTLVYSDASGFASGAFTVETNSKVFKESWSDLDKSKSSTFREIKAVFLALRSFAEYFKNKSIKWLLTLRVVYK
ncbi:hypothetical protein ACF0H5_004620 [Mactra antiquata]